MPPRRARVSVYDAVARRVNARSYIPLTPQIARTRDRASSSTVAVAPEEFLFRSRGAPEPPARDDDAGAADDVYGWTRTRPPGLRLPDGELLAALHSYVADFYAALPGGGGEAAFESLDGTALVGLAVLLEEMAAEAVGETGDLALTEASGEDGGEGVKWWNGLREVPHVLMQYDVDARRALKRKRDGTREEHPEETDPPTEAEPEDESSEVQETSSSEVDEETESE